MTPDDFRELALSLPKTTERSHMAHPDFRVADKIFATLGYPEAGWAMVKLTPEQQALFARSEPGVYVPVKGAWGRRGATTIHLKHADLASVRSAIVAAWRNTAPKRLAAEFDEDE
ncbi:MAG: MmcQ/YjbR family DNA-binding protein [Planctomycetes bacterium]|nr:MmcQ/YjbR family DNA-binding protein [Planctomycetota bacterium]